MEYDISAWQAYVEKDNNTESDDGYALDLFIEDNEVGDGLMCPVCGEHKFHKNNMFEICPVCDWIDDALQRYNPDLNGANELTLNQYIEEWNQ